MVLNPTARWRCTARLRSSTRATSHLLVKRPSLQDAAPEEETERHLHCLACGNRVTRQADRIEVSGAHEHSCTNPYGIRFHIGCFREAPGVAGIGESSGAHTWFPGYCWRIVVCGHCSTHLGWGFHSMGGDRFFGLILDRLSLSQ
jgi:hypothetical protein